jgi:hypothetical protein
MKYISLFFIGLGSVLSIPSSLIGQCNPSTANYISTTNNVKLLVNSSAELWWNFNNQNYEVPKGSGLTTTFSGSLWLGAKDEAGQLRLAATQYRQFGSDFWPGPISNKSSFNCLAFDKIWTVTSVEIENFKKNPSSITTNIENWPGKNNPKLAITKDLDLAPFVDSDADGNYDPSKGDYPLIKGDEAMFWVFNDLGNRHTETNAEPLGVEIQVMAYVFKANNAVNNATFYDYKVINKGGRNLSDFRLALFTDFDLGNPHDDYVGCDTNKQMGFVYNGDAFDDVNGRTKGYGATPPLAAIKILQAPKLNGKTYSMSSFKAIRNSTTELPKKAIDYYNLMSGLNMNGRLDTNDKGINTTYMYYGEPGKNEWSECNLQNMPGERKIVMGFGPMNLKAWESFTFSYANVFARSISSNHFACSDGIDVLKEAVDTVQSHFNKELRVSISKVNSKPEHNITTYPNPVSNLLTVRSPSDLEYNYQVVSLSGREIYSGSSQGNTSINTSEWDAGLYILHISNANGLIRTIKVLKQP